MWRGIVDVVLAVQAVWFAVLVWATTFVHGGQRYFTLFDDAMISMTYARNLVEGHGLNWARWGVPVEGFTHPLWLLFMIPVNALPLPLRLRSLPMQVLAWAFLAAAILVTHALVRNHFAVSEKRSWVPAVVLTAFYSPVVYWSAIGMETSLQTLLVLSGVYLALEITERGAPRHLALFAVCSASLLLRLDMVVSVAIVLTYVALRGGMARRHSRRIAMGAALLLLVNLGYLAFRWIYFHDVLPNTYYLKMSGYPLAARVERGLNYLVASLAPMWLLVLMAVAAAAASWRRFPPVALLGAIPCAYFAYSVWVGGDVWELSIIANRFTCFSMPLLFLVLTWLLNLAGQRFATSRRVDRVAGLALTLVGLVAANDLWPAGPDDEPRWATLIGREPLQGADTARAAKLILDLPRHLRPGARVAVDYAGVGGFFSDYELVDTLGYNDRVTARIPTWPGALADWRRWRPGHMKQSWDYILGATRPDLVMGLWGSNEERMPRFGYARQPGLPPTWAVRVGSDKLIP